MSTGPIWLDQVDCLGNETALDKCMHFDWSESNCNHTEDVSVRCSYGSFLLLLSFFQILRIYGSITINMLKLPNEQNYSKNSVNDFSKFFG